MLILLLGGKMNKKYSFLIFFTFCIAFELLISCGTFFGGGSSSTSSQLSAPQFYGSDLSASHEESEIILNGAPENRGKASVFLDGVLQQNMLAQDSIKLIVPNGQHTILVNYVTKDSDGRDVQLKGEPLSIRAQSKQYVYNISYPQLLGGSSMIQAGRNVKLELISENELTGRMATRDSRGILGAVNKAGEELIDKIPSGSTVAVLDVSADSKETSDSVIDELEYFLSNSRKFRSVNRSQLDKIRAELNYQMSGYVSDETQKSIARQLGADFLITGRVTGSGSTRRLTLTALNVETGEFEMSRAEF